MRELETTPDPPSPPPGRTSSWSGELSPELLGDARRRVYVASLVFASLWAIALVINLLLIKILSDPDSPLLDTGWPWPWPWPGALFSGIGIAAALIQAWIAKYSRVRPQRVLDVSLVVGVLQACLIATQTNWTPYIHPARVSWVCVVILLFPIIAPSTVKKTLLAGLAAATMEPVGLCIAWLRGVEIQVIGGRPLDAFTLLWAILPAYLCTGLVVIPTSIMARLGREVTRARELGSYRLGRRLGQGGMGEVYLATHRLLARPAAIKLIRPDLLGQEIPGTAALAVRRFRREAEAAATLRSPHSIEIYDFGVSGDESFYCVMEYLEGTDLQRLVERFGPVPAERAVHILRQACNSLAEAHARGMVHRDVKPSNLFVARMGLEVDFVKVLDFGLVNRPEDGNAGALITAPRTVLGSPAYMPPEALLGGRQDARSDLYSLGCVGFWLLTGRLVFEGESASQILAKHLREEPTPPSRVSELPVPGELDRTILACLAKDPGSRPDTADAVARRLEACPLPDVWTQERARRWWDTHLNDLEATRMESVAE